MAIVVVLLAAAFWGLLFVLAEVFFAIGISKAPWFEKKSPRVRWLCKASLIMGIGIFLFVFWWFVPPPDIVGALTKAFGMKAAPGASPTPEGPSPQSTLSPSPSKATRTQESPLPSTIIRGTAMVRMGEDLTVRDPRIRAEDFVDQTAR